MVELNSHQQGCHRRQVSGRTSALPFRCYRLFQHMPQRSAGYRRRVGTTAAVAAAAAAKATKATAKFQQQFGPNESVEGSIPLLQYASVRGLVGRIVTRPLGPARRIARAVSVEDATQRGDGLNLGGETVDAEPAGRLRVGRMVLTQVGSIIRRQLKVRNLPLQHWKSLGWWD